MWFVRLSPKSTHINSWYEQQQHWWSDTLDKSLFWHKLFPPGKNNLKGQNLSLKRAECEWVMLLPPCTSCLCCLCSWVALPKQHIWCFPNIHYGEVWQCCWRTSLSHVPPGVAGSPFPQVTPQSHLLPGPAQKFCAPTMQIGFQSSPSSFTSQPQVQSLYQTVPKAGQSVEPVGLRPSALEGEVAAIPNKWGLLYWDASLPTSPCAELSSSSASLYNCFFKGPLACCCSHVAGCSHPAGRAA